VTLPIKKSQETRYNFDLAAFFVNRFWGRRPDGVAINEALQIVCILEFKWSTDKDEGFLEVKEQEANQQQKSSIGAFRAAGKEDKLFADHVKQICEAHDWVILSFQKQVQGLARPTTEGLRENIGNKVHV